MPYTMKIRLCPIRMAVWQRPRGSSSYVCLCEKATAVGRQADRQSEQPALTRAQCEWQSSRHLPCFGRQDALGLMLAEI